MNPILIIVPVIFIIIRLFMSRSSLKGDDVKRIMESGGRIIDVRSPMEFKGNHVKNAKNIQHDKILAGIKKAKITKDTPLILYCASGMRSSAACRTLKSDGFTDVHNAGTSEKLRKLLNI